MENAKMVNNSPHEWMQHKDHPTTIHQNKNKITTLLILSV